MLLVEELKNWDSNAYEYGLIAFKVKEDELHKLRCLEGVIYTLGEEDII